MIDICVCVGGSCHLRGSRDVVQRLQKLVLEHDLAQEVTLRASSCLNSCLDGVCVTVNGTLHTGITPDGAEALFQSAVLSLAER